MQKGTVSKTVRDELPDTPECAGQAPNSESPGAFISTAADKPQLTALEVEAPRSGAQGRPDTHSLVQQGRRLPHSKEQ